MSGSLREPEGFAPQPRKSAPHRGEHGFSPTLLVVAGSIWLASALVFSSLPPALLAAGFAQSAEELPPGEGLPLLRARCTACHGPALIVQQRLTRDAWSRELDKMVGWGATVADGERETLLTYLAANFGRGAGTAGDAPDAAALLKARCVVCHDLQLVDQQRLDAIGWRRELDKMIGWGAAVTDAEKETLVAYLSGRAAP